MLDPARQIQPQDAHPHLRRKRQLRIHTRQGIIPAHSIRRGSRHSRSRRLIHSCLHLQHPQRQDSRRGTSPRSRDLRLRLHPSRRNAHPPLLPHSLIRLQKSNNVITVIAVNFVNHDNKDNNDGNDIFVLIDDIDDTIAPY